MTNDELDEIKNHYSTGIDAEVIQRLVAEIESRQSYDGLRATLANTLAALEAYRVENEQLRSLIPGGVPDGTKLRYLKNLRERAEAAVQAGQLWGMETIALLSNLERTEVELQQVWAAWGATTKALLPFAEYGQLFLKQDAHDDSVYTKVEDGRRLEGHPSAPTIGDLRNAARCLFPPK